MRLQIQRGPLGLFGDQAAITAQPRKRASGCRLDYALAVPCRHQAPVRMWQWPGWSLRACFARRRSSRARPRGRAATRHCPHRLWPAAHDRERGLVAGQRRRQVALRYLHVADPIVRDREVALPPGIASIGFGQPLTDRERGLVAGQRRRQVALRHLHVADLIVRDREVALPPGIARIGFGQPLSIASEAW